MAHEEVHVNLPQFPSHRHCEECELHLNVKRFNNRTNDYEFTGHPGVPTEAEGLTPTPTTPAVIFIGMNPGFNEAKHNRPFMPVKGRRGSRTAGLLLREVYVAGLDVHDVPLREHATIYYTNAIRCMEASPKVSHAVTCFPRHTTPDLLRIFASHHSAKIAVVCLGGDATVAFYRHILSTKMRLKEAMNHNAKEFTICLPSLTPSSDASDASSPSASSPSSASSSSTSSPITTPPLADEVRIAVFATYHPAFVLRTGGNMNTVVADHLQLVEQFLTDTLATPSDPHFIKPRAPITS